MEYHVTAAMRGRATRQQVIEVAAVAVALGGGVAQWPARFVFRVIEDQHPTGGLAHEPFRDRARIKVTVEDAPGQRAIHHVFGSGGSFGASPLELQIGLGKATRIGSVETYWPTSGSRQVFTDLRPNQFIQLKEFEESFTTQERRAFALGPAEPGSAGKTAHRERRP